MSAPPARSYPAATAVTAKDNVFIRDMPSELRPREQLQQHGADSLHLRELIAILLRTGNSRQSAIQLADTLLATFRTLRKLANASVEELSTIPGIGLAKASQLQAAFELGKRLSTLPEAQNPVIVTPGDAARLVMETMRYYEEEHILVLLLDTRHQLIGRKDISIGTNNMSVGHPREIFKAAISASSNALILVHNHPSGDPTPSKEDLALTARITQVGELVGIPVLDHLVIGDGRFVSLKDRGLM